MLIKSDLLVKYHKYLVAAVIVLAAFLIFTGLTRADIQSDDAIYSLRAIGYLDYTDSLLQTTPLNWFESLPTWSKLSFHDAPPLVFLIQFVFFKIFGVSDFSARLPFALAGVGSVYLLYLLARKLYNPNVALLASFILTILTYHSWASRIGYLEPIASFFILLTFYLFFAGLKNPKLLLLFGVSLGLAFLSKYTAFFVLPVVIVYLAFKSPKLLISKNFIIGLAVALLVFSPVLYYNWQIWQTRGHLDLQFTQLLGMDMSDWPGISSGGIANNYGRQFISAWKETGSLVSTPAYVLFLLSLIFILVNFVVNFIKKRFLFLVLVFLFLSIQFTLVGGEVRFLSLFNPFIALVIAAALAEVYKQYSKKFPKFDLNKKIFIVFVIAIFIFELFYNINTNILPKPVGDKGRHYSTNRLENGGFSQAEKFFINELQMNGLSRFKINTLTDAAIDPTRDLPGGSLVIFDPNLKWFSTLWYFRRWSIYHHQPFASAAEVAQALPGVDWFVHFKELGVENLYYVWAQNPAFYGGSANQSDKVAAARLAQLFEAAVPEMTDIFDSNGNLAFKIYKLRL